MVHSARAKFDRIYDLQAEERVFDSPEEIWSECLSRRSMAALESQRLKESSYRPSGKRML